MGTQFTDIVLKKEGNIATILLSRPEKLNAIRRQTLIELKSAIEDIKADENIFVVIITGAGKAFSSGWDLSERSSEEQTLLEKRKTPELIYEALGTIERLDRPVIAAINGHCIGAAHELVLACDIAIAAEDAKISYPEINYGVASILQAALMPRYASIGRVREIMFTGEAIDAHEAERIGLVNRVVPRDQLLTAAMDLAKKIASKPRLGMKLQKELINQHWLRSDLESAIVAGINVSSIGHSTGESAQRMKEYMKGAKNIK